jgi:hypothetical protein
LEGVVLIKLADIQAEYRRRIAVRHRNELPRYLVEGEESSSLTFSLVSHRLYANKQIDNLGLTDLWLDRSKLSERASLFSSIATDMLKGSGK